MKEVRKSDYTFRTEEPHIFGDNCSMGHALQYYGGTEGILISWTPNYHRILHCEKSKSSLVIDYFNKPIYYKLKTLQLWKKK